MNAYSKGWYKFSTQCDECGKHRKYNRYYSVMWNVGYDWADGDSETYCIPCLVKFTVKNLIWAVKRGIRILKETASVLWLTKFKFSIKKAYHLAVAIERR